MLMGVALLVSWVFLNPVRAVPTLSGMMPNFKIVINIPATELRLFEDNELLRRIPIAVGQGQFPTPVKEDHLTYIVWNPWWLPPDSDWAKGEKPTPPGPDNPLGVVKMPLSNAILLHGTSKPSSIGTAASHACIRMFNDDARSLAWTFQSHLTAHFDESLLEEYAQKSWKTVNISLAKSVSVRFIYEVIELEGDQLTLHPDVYHRLGNKKAALLGKLKLRGIHEDELDIDVLETVLREWQKNSKHVAIHLSDLLKTSQTAFQVGE